MNISSLFNFSLPVNYFEGQNSNSSDLPEKITIAASIVFIPLISLSLMGFCRTGVYKFVGSKTSNAKAFYKSLETWKSDAAVKGDKETAYKKIGEAFDKKLIELGLEGLSLNSLPEAIGHLTHLQFLCLENNQLKSLPKTIGNLTQLQSLFLHNNCLQSLPETIGNLTQLQCLFLQDNCLQSLPETIGNLAKLKSLILCNNYLTALPQSMSNLQALFRISVNNNVALAELPTNFDQIISLSFIYYQGTLISAETVENILASSQLKRDNQEDLIPRLKDWASINNFQSIDETKIKSLEIKEKQTLNEWLKRLEVTEDYQNNQKPLFTLVCQLIQTVLEEKEFKTVFMTQAEINNESCEDRSAMNLNVIYLYWKLYCLPPESSLKDKLELLIKASKTLTLRKKLQELILAREIENEREEIESVEIYLYYEMTLQKELNLLTAIQEMTYSPIGEREWINLEELKASVQKDYLIELTKLDAFDQLAETDPSYCQEWQLLENHYADLILNNPTSEVSTQREKAKIKLIQKWLKSLSL